MSFTCPCGCALQLTPEDEANERRMIALLGPTPRHVNLRVGGETQSRRKDPPEPKESGVCRGCGEPMDLAVYLAEFLRLRGAPWPHCETCVRGRQTDLWSAA